MAAEMIGIDSEIERVSRVAVETSAGSTADAPGFIKTSSKVRYSGIWRRAIGQPFNERDSLGLAAVLNTRARPGASGEFGRHTLVENNAYAWQIRTLGGFPEHA
jgi:hypothetical protein